KTNGLMRSRLAIADSAVRARTAPTTQSSPGRGARPRNETMKRSRLSSVSHGCPTSIQGVVLSKSMRGGVSSKVHMTLEKPLGEARELHGVLLGRLGGHERHFDARHRDKGGSEAECDRAARLDAHVRMGALALEMRAERCHAGRVRREFLGEERPAVAALGDDQLPIRGDLDAEVALARKDGSLHGVLSSGKSAAGRSTA